MTKQEIALYGADWCSDCRRVKNFLDDAGVDYEYINLVDSPEQADVALKISGRTSIPVITFPDGSHQVEPSNSDLEAKLREVNALH